MKLVREEYHQLTRTMTYHVDEDEMIEEFGSLEAFNEAKDEDTDEFNEFINCCSHESVDDIWTDLKGGYDIGEFEVIEE